MPASVYPTGTTIYDPSKSWNGYTLFQAAGDAVLIDMNGNTVNRWQGLAGHPVKMLPGGHVMGSSTHQSDLRYVPWDKDDVIQVDWDGNVEWRFNRYERVDVPGAEPAWTAHQHHDYEREGNPVGYYVPGMAPLVDRGSTLICCHKKITNRGMSEKPLVDSTIIEVTWDGEIVWEWICSDHFEEMGFNEPARLAVARKPAGAWFRPASDTNPGVVDWIHMNSISPLGPNSWFEGGDERFHPDNIIWSSPTANMAAIVDRKTDKIVWQVGPDYTSSEALRNLGQMLGPHHAHMIPRGLPGEGNILVYDNGGCHRGYISGSRDYSRVLEFNPVTLETVWQYTPREAGFVIPEQASQFYSFSISGMQRLLNGNTLICEGNDSRLFEVTPDHEIVWEHMVPPAPDDKLIQVYRAYRVPYEWVPQVDRPEERALPRIDNARFRVKGSPRKKAARVTKIKGL